jgi:bacteriorhodopsin
MLGPIIFILGVLGITVIVRNIDASQFALTDFDTMILFSFILLQIARTDLTLTHIKRFSCCIPTYRI